MARSAVIVIAIAAVASMSTLVVRAQMLGVGAESAVIGELSAHVRTVETMSSQAIVFALDRDAGVVDPASASAALAALEQSASRLRDVDTTALTAPPLNGFVVEVGRLAGDLRVGDVAMARLRFSTALRAERSELDAVMRERLVALDARANGLERAERRIAWIGLMAAVLAIPVPLVAGIVPALRSRRGRHEAVAVAVAPSQAIVIQLPDEPNDLPMRRRHPRVEDLGWLLEQILAPYTRRGWLVDVSCPAVGVDCDPADLREMVGSMLMRADGAGADSIGIVVRTVGERVRITIADDGRTVFGDDGNAVGHGLIWLRSAVRTRAEAAGATLTWRRNGELNVATLDMPRLIRSDVKVLV